MRLAPIEDSGAVDWLRYHHGVEPLQHPRLALGVVDRSNALRGVYMLTWTHNRTAELHIYGTATPDTAKAIFRHAFGIGDVWRLEVRIPAKGSPRMRRVVPRYGFKFEARARDFYGPGEDALVYAMTPGDCRWIRRH